MSAAKRLTWLCNELAAGNAFSAESLLKWADEGRTGDAAFAAMLAALEFITAPQPYSATQQWRDNLKRGREMVAEAIALAKAAE